MLNIATIRPGQRVTVRYSAPVTWARTTDNPFVDMLVERNMTVQFTTAGPDTYGNMADKLGHETSGKAPWHVPAPEVGPCVRKHNKTGKLYLSGINHDTVAAVFTIGGVPASGAEATQIRTFLRVREERERGIDFRVWSVDNLQNAVVA
jgi:hypothetical protein